MMDYVLVYKDLSGLIFEYVKHKLLSDLIVRFFFKEYKGVLTLNSLRTVLVIYFFTVQNDA